MRWLLDGITWRRSDPWLASFVDCSARRPGQPARTGPGSGRRLRAPLCRARIAVDNWHLVALANQMVTEVRQRVTRDELGRRGTTADPVWVNRRLLLTGAEHLTPKRWTRLNATMKRCDPTSEIGAA